MKLKIWNLFLYPKLLEKSDAAQPCYQKIDFIEKLALVKTKKQKK